MAKWFGAEICRKRWRLKSGENGKRAAIIMANIGERDIFIYLFDSTRLVQLGVKTSLKGDICKKVCETETNGKEMLYGGIK